MKKKSVIFTCFLLFFFNKSIAQTGSIDLPEREFDHSYASPKLIDSDVFRQAFKNKIKLKSNYGEQKKGTFSYDYLYFFIINTNGGLEPQRYFEDKLGYYKKVRSFITTEFNHYRWNAGYKKKNRNIKTAVLLELMILTNTDENEVTVEIIDNENKTKVVYFHIPYKELN